MTPVQSHNFIYETSGDFEIRICQLYSRRTTTKPTQAKLLSGMDGGLQDLQEEVIQATYCYKKLVSKFLLLKMTFFFSLPKIRFTVKIIQAISANFMVL